MRGSRLVSALALVSVLLWPAGARSQGSETVKWANLVGVAAPANRLTKTDTGLAWTAGAVSTKGIASGDGYVEITPMPGDDYVVIGLGNGDSSQGFGDVEFGFSLTDGAIEIIEGGVSRGSFGSYTSQSQLRVAVESGVVRYRKDGALLYESQVSPSYPLLVDTSLYAYGTSVQATLTGTLTALSVEPVAFSVPTGNYATPQSVTLTTATSGALIHYTTSGAAPTESDPSVTSGGTVVVDETVQLKARAFKSGLGASAIASASYSIGESSATEPVAWANLVKVAASGNRVTKTDTAEVWDASAVSTKAILAGDGHVDITPVLGGDYLVVGLGNGDQGFGDLEYGFLLTNGTLQIIEAGLLRGSFGTYTSQSQLRIAAEGGVVKYRRDGALLYESLVPPSYPLLVDASIYTHGASVRATLTGVLTALSVEPVAFSVPSGNYASAQTVALTTATPGALVHFTTNGSEPTESDSSVASGGTVAVSQTLQLRARAFKSGLGPSAVTSAHYVIGQTSVTEAVAWTNLVKVAAAGNKVTKTDAESVWDAGAVSTKGIVSGDGYVDLTPALGNDYLLVGLGNGDTSQSYADVEHGFFLQNGVLEIIESGYHRGSFGTYTSQSQLRIGVEGGVVKYRRDGALLYESPVPPSYPLLVDSSLLGYGSSVRATLTGVLVALSVEPVAFSVPSGSYASSQTIALTTATAGASIHYTTDPNGAAPTQSDPSVASGGTVVVSQTQQLRAKGFASGLGPSAVTSAWYAIGQSSATETVQWANRVLTAVQSGALVKTGSSSDPDAGAVSTRAIVVGDGYAEITAGSGTAVVGLANGDASQHYNDVEFGFGLMNGTLQIFEGGVSRGSFGSYTSQSQLRIAVETGVVKYRRDGALLYESTIAPTYPLLVDTSLATPGGSVQSVALSGVLVSTIAATPTFDPVAGSYAVAPDVALSAVGAQSIRYTADGSEPNGSSPLYSSPITITTNPQTIKAKAFASGLFASETASATYDLKVGTPTPTPGAGTYSSAQSVSLATATPGATIRYTTDGSQPDQTSAIYSTPIGVSTATTIKAKGYKAGWTDSDTATALYTFNYGTLATPTATPGGGTYSTPQTVTLSGPSGAAIRYTTDGSEPTQASAIYGSPLSISAPTTLKAKAFQIDWTPSATLTAVYDFKVATPSMAPPAGTYAESQSVTLSTATPAAEIRYTTDSSEPTAGSTLYSTPITVAMSTTIKAKAFRSSWQDSDTATATYTITGGVIDGGFRQSFVRKPDGTVWAWGTNGILGSLGDGTTTDRFVPTANALSGVASLAAGSQHGLALLPNGTVKAWGRNSEGQVGDNTQTQRPTPVTLSGISGATQVVAGTWHSVALKSDGTVWAWGYNAFGQIGDNSTTQRLVPTQASGVSGVSALAQSAATAHHTLVVKSDGTLLAWGYNGFGQLGNASTSNSSVAVQVTGISTAVSAASGGSYSLALLSDGTLKAWGNNGNAQLGDGTTTQRTSPVSVSVLTNVVAVAAGQLHSLALKSDGTVWAWGYNANGQLGDGTQTQRSVPTQVPGLTNVIAIGAGDEHSLALTADGQVWAWGLNAGGQLGDGTPVSRFSPRQISQSNYLWLAGTPVFSPVAGGYTAVQNVVVTTASPGATIRYTTNGVDPTESDPSVASGGTVEVNQSLTLKARAFKAELAPSHIHSGTYTLTVPTPSLAPGTATYASPQNVVVSESLPSTTIHYTTNGVDPTTSDPTVASGGTVSVAQSMTLKAKAFRTGWTPSAVVTGVYTLKVATPALTPAAGSYGSPQSVTATTASPDVELHYTTNGLEPTLSDPLYTEAVLVDHSLTLKVKGMRAFWTASDTASATYVIAANTVAAPTLTPNGGTFGGPQTVSMTTSTTGGLIRYTMNGSDPGVSSTVYSGPISITGNATVRARAYRSGWTPSAVTVGTYDLGTEAAPSMSPPGGFYAVGQTVVLTSSSGTTIHYTTDGTEPTLASPSVATGGSIAVAESLLLRAKAWPSGAGTPSQTARGDYWITGQISAGYQHSLALKSDGTVYAFGINANGQLGDGSTTSRIAPGAVTGATNVKQVAAGTSFSLALKTDGTVLAWGLNSSGQLGDGTPTQRTTPVLVQASGGGNLTGVVAIAAGQFHSLALKSDGTVVAWGANANGQLGDGTQTAHNVATAVTGLTDVVAVAAGGFFSLALKSDGSVKGWGENFSGQLGDGTQTRRLSPVTVLNLIGVTQIAAGDSHGVAIRTDGNGSGTLWAWGANQFGQLGDGGTTGRLQPASGIANVTRIAAGNLHTLALTADGGEWAWGLNSTGQIGDYSTTGRTSPTFMGRDQGWTAVTGGVGHSLALDIYGAVWSWGAAFQIGEGTGITNRLFPKRITGFTLAPATWATGDADQDGLTNGDEAILGTDPTNGDTNGDGISDLIAVRTAREALSADVDSDGLTNGAELAAGTDPFNADTDGDGVLDGADAFPLDATKSAANPVPGDTTPPTITLTQPSTAVPIP